MAFCLDMIAAAPTSMQRPFQQQTEDLVRELLTFRWCMIEHNLSTLMQLHVTNVVDPPARLPASGDPRDFPTILARMQVGPGQAKQLLATRRAWLNAMGAITAEPDNILVYLKLLTPLQTAQYVVGCLPMGPDTPALLSCLAKQYGEPATDDLLRAARPGTAASLSASSGARAVASSGGAAVSGLPPCMAGDWRRALTTPLRVLHGTRPQLPLIDDAQAHAAGYRPGRGEGGRTGGRYVGAQIVPCISDGSASPISTFYAPVSMSSGAALSNPCEAPH
ncbi:g8588 [Coccomyxa elongata]